MVPNRLILPGRGPGRLLLAVLGLTLVAMAFSAPVVLAKGGGNSPNAKLCYKGGWEDWVRQDQTAFANQDACVSYAAMGGTLTVPGPHVFARAFSNVDGIAGFNSIGDVLIAELVDGNGNDLLDGGDLVRTYTYPTNLAMTTFASFGVTSHVVVSVTTATSTSVQVMSATGTFVWRIAVSGTGLPEVFGEVVTADDSLHAAFVDGRGGGSLPEFCNILDVTTGSPSQPQTSAAETACGDTTDQPFLDVGIDLGT